MSDLLSDIPSIETLRAAIEQKMGPIDTSDLPADAAEISVAFTDHTRQVGAHIAAMLMLSQKSLKLGYVESAYFMRDTTLHLLLALKNAGSE
ncbi:MAG: hypothetical protein ACKO0Z_06985 [Betaproteobacteria bacterium]